MKNLAQKIKATLFFPIGWTVCLISNIFLGTKYTIEVNPLEELKHIWRCLK